MVTLVLQDVDHRLVPEDGESADEADTKRLLLFPNVVVYQVNFDTLAKIITRKGEDGRQCRIVNPSWQERGREGGREGG